MYCPLNVSHCLNILNVLTKKDVLWPCFSPQPLYIYYNRNAVSQIYHICHCIPYQEVSFPPKMCISFFSVRHDVIVRTPNWNNFTNSERLSLAQTIGGDVILTCPPSDYDKCTGNKEAVCNRVYSGVYFVLLFR